MGKWVKGDPALAGWGLKIKRRIKKFTIFPDFPFSLNYLPAVDLPQGDTFVQFCARQADCRV